MNNNTTHTQHNNPTQHNHSTTQHNNTCKNNENQSFFMGRGAVVSGVGHPKIFELKGGGGGGIPKVEEGRGFLQVNVLV